MEFVRLGIHIGVQTAVRRLRLAQQVDIRFMGKGDIKATSNNEEIPSPNIIGMEAIKEDLQFRPMDGFKLIIVTEDIAVLGKRLILGKI